MWKPQVANEFDDDPADDSNAELTERGREALRELARAVYTDEQFEQWCKNNARAY